MTLNESPIIEARLLDGTFWRGPTGDVNCVKTRPRSGDQTAPPTWSHITLAGCLMEAQIILDGLGRSALTAIVKFILVLLAMTRTEHLKTI